MPEKHDCAFLTKQHNIKDSPWSLVELVVDVTSLQYSIGSILLQVEVCTWVVT
jgi:hypothetical protein